MITSSLLLFQFWLKHHTAHTIPSELIPPSLLPNGKGGLLSRALKRAAQRDVLSAKLHQTAKQAAKELRSQGSPAPPNPQGLFAPFVLIS